MDRIQWNNGGTWTDVPNPLIVAKGTLVTFVAITNPSGATWLAGKPVWGGTSGASGTGETTQVTFSTTSSSTTDFKTVTAECGNTVTVNVLVVEIDRIQWNNNGTWTDVTGTLTVPTGGTLSFKAISKPSGASWPSGQPVWGGSSGASGTGETTTVTFNTTSYNTTDFKTVTATCGSTVTVNVLVVGVDRIQWNNGGTWTDVTGGTLAVAQSSTVSFKALPNPSGASWPSGQPVWGGTSGVSGSGTDTATATFNTVSSSTTDFKTVTATCGNTVTVNVLVVGVDHIQWNNGGTWTDITAGTLAVAQSSTVSFKALPNPSGASWPSGQPVWGGTSGASASGTDTTSVTFSTASSSTTDFKTVTATCGNTVTVNVLVVYAVINEVDFTSDPGVLTDYNTDYSGSGGTVYSPRGWVNGGANNPITHTQGQSVSINATVCVQPSGVAFNLTGTGPIGALSFQQTGLTSTGTNQSVAMTSNGTLAAQIDILNDSISWSVVVNGLSFNAGSSGPHKIYVTWGAPGSGPTLKRVSWACGIRRARDR